MSNFDLSVDICGVKLKNPVIAASGTFGYGREMEDFFDPSILGAISTKGISLEPKAGNPPIRICETASGMLNAIGLNNVGLKSFIKDKMPAIRQFENTACIVNFYGNCISNYALLAEKLSEVDGVHLLEMNISCPNVKEGGIVFGSDPVLMREVISETKLKSTKPIIVKLSPNVTNIGDMAEVAVAAGADAISLINTITGMAVDINSQKPILANVIGGLSGPAIKPVALRMVHEVCGRVDVPVIGIGGIRNAVDALEFMMVGAKAVQIGTASFVDPMAMPNIISGMEEKLKELSVSSIHDWTGSLKL